MGNGEPALFTKEPFVVVGVLGRPLIMRKYSHANKINIDLLHNQSVTVTKP
jgi:hypothetical protein